VSEVQRGGWQISEQPRFEGDEQRDQGSDGDDRAPHRAHRERASSVAFARHSSRHTSGLGFPA
jgi:hypothetical protein